MHPKTKPFAHWILGYQNFYEGIIRAYLEHNGFESIEHRSVVGSDLEPSALALESNQHSIAVSEGMLEWASTEMRRKANGKQTRVQLDVLVRSSDGVFTGECKSWGGFYSHANWKAVADTFVEGSDARHHSLFMYLTEIRGEPVAGTILILWRRSDEHELIEERLSSLFGRRVMLYYIDEILRDPSAKVREAVDDRLMLLDDSTNLVREMLGVRD